MTEYLAIIHKDPESDFGVIFPDFPGCTTVGRTQDEARVQAQEALEFHIEGMVEDGTAIPATPCLDQVIHDPSLGMAFVVKCSRLSE